MKIAVCIKRVPDTESRIKPAADGKSLDEAGIKFITQQLAGFEKFIRKVGGK